MRVICIKNTIGAITETKVRERIRRSIHLQGPITDLAVGREYAIQAIEERDGGLWLYLHTVAENDYPYPCAAEMFEFCDSTLPSGWSVHIESQQGSLGLKRITFVPWATDNHFYERLVDGDAATVSLYRRLMAT